MKVHIVLETNPDAVMMVGGKAYTPEKGGIYLMDASLLHSSVNNGTTDRVHLIIS